MGEQYLNLPVDPADTAFGLMAEHDADSHPNKVSLIPGAYRDEDGKPWILPSVEKAKARVQQDPSHEYLDIAGSPALIKQAQLLTFGTEIIAKLKKPSIASIQTVSGTGANHMAAQFLSQYLRPARVFIPSPTWINHKTIWAAAGVQVWDCPYYTPETRAIDLEGMLAVLENNSEDNDVLLLQACAHNPTGVDPSHAQWAQIVDVVKRKKLFVVFDIAYQGFATGDINGDAWAVRYFVDRLILNGPPEYPGLFVAQSFSKNFGLYGERVGALHLVVPQHVSAQGARSKLVGLARSEYSNPPRFGSSLVETVLENKNLREQWERDLVTMSERIKTMRQELRRKLEENGAQGDWSFIESQIGMFSFLDLDRDQIDCLKRDFHIYILPSGRVSICGLNGRNIDYVAMAIVQVLGLGHNRPQAS
ncbi:Aspartate aminotransferase, cytoplasmic [Penicillium rolfsii]|nr:Aspartate aminotransferase, cytoplasmic [Penicillium rolfsii]